MTSPVPAGTPVLELADASYGYLDRAIVTGVSLTVDAGEVVAVLGPNGSGKSTLVKGVLGLCERMGGSTRLFGVPQEDFRDKARIGYVPQRHTLSASVRATVSEVVAIGRLPHRRLWARPGRRDRAIIAESLELVGLADRAYEDVSTLSGGQQRRVLIARALAAQPDVLVLDEPTAGVDQASQVVLSQVLARLAARDTTMVIVTHELEALRPVVTRIVALADGRVAYDGAPTPLLAGDPAHHHDDENAEPARTGALGTGPLDSPAPAHWRTGSHGA